MIGIDACNCPPYRHHGRCNLWTGSGRGASKTHQNASFFSLNSTNWIETCFVVLPTTAPGISTAVTATPRPEVGVEHQKVVLGTWTHEILKNKR